MANADLRDSGKLREFIIEGTTHAGQSFRPSDWAERLCGVLACFRPEDGGMRPGSRQVHLAYSPYARPITLHGKRCVAVDERLRDIEPRAWDFVRDFACDNNLITYEACLLSEDDPT